MKRYNMWGVMLISATLLVLSAIAGSTALGWSRQGFNNAEQCPPGCELSCSFDPATGTISCECRCHFEETPPPVPTATPPGEATPGPTPTSGTTPVVPTPSPTPQGPSTHLEIICTIDGCLDGSDQLVGVMVDNATGEIVDIVFAYCGECSASPTPTPQPIAPVPPPPCEDLEIGPGGISCVTDYLSQVASTVPTPRIARTPFPRGLVRLPNTLSLHSPTLGGEAWSNPLPLGVPDVETRNWQLGLRWRWLGSPEGSWVLSPAPPPTRWVWDEREWNIAAGIRAVGFGNQATHIYLTSSWGKPRNGPGGLPSYQVVNETFWGAEWAVGYERLECVAWKEEMDEEGNPKMVCVRWEWRSKFNGWNPVDLRYFGYPTWYFTQPVVEPVPIIEVQGVIHSGR